MKIDWDCVEGATDYVTVPAGTYLCKITEVQTGSTRAGDDRWGLRLTVAEGEFIGRQAAWDSLVFSPRGLARVRQVFTALRLPTQGHTDVDPEDLMGRQAFVEVRHGEYRSPETGQVVRRNEVPYSAYTPAPEGMSTGSLPNEEDFEEGQESP